MEQLRREPDRVPLTLLYVTVAFAALLPEYLAPLMTLFFFPVFKRNCSKLGRKVAIGNTGKALLLFALFGVVSALWSITPIMSAAVSLLWAGMMLGMFQTGVLINTRERLEKLVLLFAAGGGAVGAIGTVQYVLLLFKVPVNNPFWLFLDRAIYRVLPFAVQDTSPVWHTSRAASTFDNPLIVATYLLLVLPFAVAGIKIFKGKRFWACLVSGLFCVGGILGTSSRAAAVASILGLVLFVALSEHNWKRIVAVSATTLVAGFFFVLVIFNRYLRYADDFENSTQTRVKIWKACLTMFREHPLLGNGAGCEGTALGLARQGIAKPHAHNLFLELTAELGLVGLLFFAAILTLILIDVVKLVLYHGFYGRLGAAFAASMLGFLIASMTEFTLQTPKELQFFMLFLGAVEATKRLAPKRERKKDAAPPEPAPQTAQAAD